MLFISYSSLDKELADTVRRKMTERGVECWMAPESISPGSNYANDIPAAIRDCDAVLVILTERSQQSVWVPKELDTAFRMRKTVFPLHLDESEIVPAFQLYFSNVQLVEVSKRLDPVLDTISDMLSGKFRMPNSADLPSNLPDRIRMYDLLHVRSQKDIDIHRIRSQNDVTRSLAAPFGQNEQGETVFLDIHHRADGPNGLCCGPAGSGKTEFINTFLLSLALNFSPDDILFYLVDFEHYAYDLLRILPHLAGAFTEIDGKDAGTGFTDALKNEIEKRERLLKEFEAANIYQYLKKRKAAGYRMPPMPHILIVVDELADLKREWPEIADSITELGAWRSTERFGFHILWCTSRPSGVINDRIYSSLSYQVCSSMYQNIAEADGFQSERSRPGRLFFASPTLDTPQLVQVAYTGDKSALPAEGSAEMWNMGWQFFAKKQGEALAGAIARYELD